jgi:hypothetical protein
MFKAIYNVLLDDLTSPYFEVDANGPVVEARQLKAFGYSRDKRPDCLQIVIALVITPEGLPIGYEGTFPDDRLTQQAGTDLDSWTTAQAALFWTF